jgi:hypothetical protein
MMERKFIHERFRNPDCDIIKFERALYDVGFPDFSWKKPNDNISTSDVIKAAHSYGLKKDKAIRYLENMDGKLTTVDMYIINQLVNRDIIPHVFLKDFFDVLFKANINKIKWSMLPSEFNWVIRLPYPIFAPANTNPYGLAVSIDEIYVSCEKLCDELNDIFIDADQQGRGDRSLYFFGIATVTREDGSTYETLLLKTAVVFLDDSFIIDHEIFDTKYDHSLLFFIMKCLVYINSGNPDLREMRNPIRYKSPTSQTAVREHKQFSIPPFNVVGFNWKKERMAHVDSWGVEPFMRFQPYGPGRSQYKYVMVKEHTRSHRKAAIVIDESVT